MSLATLGLAILLLAVTVLPDEEAVTLSIFALLGLLAIVFYRGVGD